MNEENIWANLNLSEDNLKTTYDYLLSQVENFRNATKGELEMEIEVSRETSSGPRNREMTIYYLYIVAPKLGNFRKKIIHIVEFDDQGRFPVNLYNYLESDGITNIEENNLLETLKNVLSDRKIQNTIENLFKQSIETRKNT